MADPQNIVQRLDTLDTRLDRLTNAVDMLVTEFLRPLTQQAVENHQAISKLIEASQRHQEWLDEDRQDLADYRQQQREQSAQIQVLIDEAREDRKRSDERFEAMQGEIRQSRQQSDERFEAMQGEIRQNRQQSDERFEAMQGEIRQNQRLLLDNQQKLNATFDEILSLSRRVSDVEEAA